MPRHTRSLAIALALTSFGLVTAQQDSPAFALFGQIVDRLETEYVNPNNLELGSITKKYKTQLEAQCANVGESCCAVTKPNPARVNITMSF